MLTQRELISLLEYDKETGVFTWKASNSNRIANGKVAGSVNDKGYLDIRVNNKLYRAHRLAWMYEYGEMPRGVIDHINGVRTDNRIVNLRDVNQIINGLNRHVDVISSSGCRGVTWCHATKKWRAKIQIDGKSKHLGRFDIISDAADAYQKAKEEYFQQQLYRKDAA